MDCREPASRRKGTGDSQRDILRICCGEHLALCGESRLQSPQELRRLYIHEQPGWPQFRWDAEQLGTRLAAIRHRQGRLAGRMEGLGFPLQREAALETLTADVLKSSEIEGEQLDTEEVRSSLARRLGMDTGALKRADRRVEGVVEMMVDATRNYAAPLTVQRLQAWQAALFPTGHSGLRRIRAGAWRTDATGPMQVISGPLGNERVHFEAPAAARIEGEVGKFLGWFEAPQPLDPVLKAGLAHLWFVTIHPFEDGNGRVARAIADLALSRSEGSAQRFYSMSSQIRAERSAYYSGLERAQGGTLDVTAWLEWFLSCLGRAIEVAHGTLDAVLRKARVWERMGDLRLNERQRGVVNRLLDGLEGKLTTSKYAKLARCSQDTAHRDIVGLMEAGILVQGPAGGRSTAYAMRED
ncbi:MAG: Fic family protein [Acidobacteria bacterium]|nr:Fic family protein [Acidobacteriota bacterium]